MAPDATLTSAIATLMSAIATVVIAILSYQVYRSNKRIEWLTGAMESHSEIQLVIAAKEANMEVIWWDPTESAPPIIRKHGEPRDLRRVYTFLPLPERKGSQNGGEGFWLTPRFSLRDTLFTLLILALVISSFVFG